MHDCNIKVSRRFDINILMLLNSWNIQQQGKTFTKFHALINGRIVSVYKYNWCKVIPKLFFPRFQKTVLGWNLKIKSSKVAPLNHNPYATTVILSLYKVYSWQVQGSKNLLLIMFTLFNSTNLKIRGWFQSWLKISYQGAKEPELAILKYEMILSLQSIWLI